MIILAILLGLIFGFVLQRIGASNPQNIINMLRLTDFHLMKTILLGIAIASALLFLSIFFDLINVAHISVKVSQWGVIVGGIIFGIGWAIAGYCPGTGLAGLGEGRKDALFFVLGGLFGSLLYMLAYGFLTGSFLFADIFGGKTTLAETSNEGLHATFSNINGVIVALVIACILFLIATLLPSNYQRKNNQD